MRGKRPLAFLLVAVLAMSLFAAMPAAAQDDCNALSVNAGSDSVNVGTLGSLSSTSSNAVVAPDQSQSQANIAFAAVSQSNFAAQNQC